MTRILKTLTAAVIVACGSPSFAQDDDLFSDVRASSVFDSSAAANSNSSSSGARSAKRITSTENLRELLKSAGFEAKVASSRAVTTEKKLDSWTFPVMLEIAEDETQIRIVLGLSTINDVAKELPAETLLKMMAVSQKNAPVLFTYDVDRKRTELLLVAKNQGLNGTMLRDEINRLAVMAKSSSDLWNLKKDDASVAAPKTESNPASADSTTGLAGKWSAARSAAEAFAVEFTAAGTFNLVYINSGKQTRSTGKFTVADGSLSLVGKDGSKLAGKLTIASETEFRLELQNSKALVFRKAK